DSKYMPHCKEQYGQWVAESAALLDVSPATVGVDGAVVESIRVRSGRPLGQMTPLAEIFRGTVNTLGPAEKPRNTRNSSSKISCLRRLEAAYEAPTLDVSESPCD
ncbi:MAG TPA: hypothetical protein VH640_05470, partial [Bryobacteraceae bacterium]